MGDFLTALSSAFSDSGLPLPPPDERIAIDTVQSQNRGLRKRTVAVKRVGGAAEPATASQAAIKPVAAGTGSSAVVASKPVSAESSKPNPAAKSSEVKRLPSATPAPATASPAAPKAAASQPAPAATAAATPVAKPATDGRTGEFKPRDSRFFNDGLARHASRCHTQQPRWQDGRI